MAKSYGISEIARELGVSKQCVHQKVKKCLNPYLKYQEGKGRPQSLSVKAEIVNFLGWVCPNCQATYRVNQKEKRLSDRVFCQECKKTFHLVVAELEKGEK